MTETSLSDAAIARIAAGLLDRRLPKAEWTHAGHFASALWLLRWQQGFDGPRDLPAIIRAYNEATGGVNSDSEGYHQTITLASVRAATAALADGAGAPLSEILAALLAGPLGRSDWPLEYWHKDTLFSLTARRDWVEPDRAALPF